MAYQVKFTCRSCGEVQLMTAPYLADYYASENEEDLQCWSCRPIRLKPPAAIPAGYARIIITHLNKQVDKWARAKKVGGK